MDRKKKEEVKLTLFQLARSGNYDTAASLRAAVKERYPSITSAELVDVINSLSSSVAMRT